MGGGGGDGAAGDVGEGGQAELGAAVAAGGDLIHLGELVPGAGQADLQSFGLAEPAGRFGLGDTGGQVAADLSKARPLGGVGAQQRAAQAPLTELTTLFQHFTARFRSLALTYPRDRIG